MASDTYYRYQDLEKDSDKLYIIPDDIVIYLVQSQVDQIRAALTEATRAKGKLRKIDTERFISTEAIQTGLLLDSDVYVITKGVETKYLGPGDSEHYLDMFPKINDANKLAQTDISYNKDEPDNLPDDRNFVKKLHKWIDLDLIEKDDYNNIIMSIVRSSGSVHNDWVYSLSGEDEGRGQGEVLDIHDRRIDDPNVPLTVKGGVNVGDPDNASDRKKLSVFGETELQDGTTMGKLLDTYGEQHPMEFGHLIPDNGQYPKVYVNRGEDRFNAEDWDDGTYGLGFGTVEAGREIVSHTTISADRGVIIEDGVGDEKDKIIQKNVRNSINYFEPTGAPDHQTNGFALSVKHDGAKIQGHTYVQDEDGANQYFIDNGVISRPNASVQNGTNFEDIDLTALGAPFRPGCWFCEEDEAHHNNDWQYIHYCTNKDNDIEPVEDRWYGHLYYEGTRSIHGHKDWKYCYNGNEFYYDGHFHKILTHRDAQVGEVFRLSNDDSIYYSLDVNPLSDVLEQYIYHFKGEYTDDPNRAQASTKEYPIYYVPGLTLTQTSSEGVEDWGEELEYTANIRVIPKINMIYQIKQGYTQAADLYALVDAGTYNANDYFYWNGAKYVKISQSKSTYKPNQDFGALTVGTRANGIQANDTIGKHSVEIGTDNEATGNNALAQGQRTIADGVSSHAEGYGTKVTGPFAHAEGLGGQAGFVFKSVDDEELASIASVVSDLDSLTPSEGEYYKLDEDSTIVYYAVFYGESEETTGLPYPTIVNGVASHAEGYGQIVDGKYNHAEGNQNKILGDNTTSTHVEGSENIINEDANFSHIEGKNNIILAEKEGAHAAGAGNVIDRRYQHLEGVLAKTTHQVGTYIKGDNQDAPKSVMFAIGDGDSPTRADQSGLTPAANIVGHRDDPNYEEGNLFAITEDGDAYVAGHLEVDGTSDLSKRATIGDDVAAHELALDVLRHSRFRENVSIDAHGATSNVQGVTDWNVDKSLDVKGQSLFGDTLTIGEAGTYNNTAANRTGTFWKNLDQNLQGSQFIGLNVHGEIKNERIPNNLYTSTIIQGTRVFNEFADKFWTNSSIATNTATYRGCYTKEDYEPDHVDPLDKDAMAAWLDANVSPFVAGQITNVATYNALPIPALVSVNTIYHTLDTNKYYQWVWDVVEPGQTPTTGDYEEVDATPDKNDYCFVQIEENGSMLPYVLFPDNEGEEIEIGEVEEEEPIAKTIVTHRYKYVQIIDPVTEKVLNQGWRFEYQLNNSGFTQAQWDTINSGVTASWKVGIERDITTIQSTLQSEVDRLDGRIDKEIEDRQRNIGALVGKLNNDFVTKSNTHWSYSYDEERQVGTWTGTDIEIDTIVGKKNFTNPNGVGINGVYLKNTNNSAGYFSLPNQNHINETLLSTSDLNNYIEYAETPQKSGWRATNEVPEFRNGLCVGYTYNNEYWYSALQPGVDGHAYCLPGGKQGRNGIYELALKSDFYTKDEADYKYQTKTAMSNYVTCNNTPEDQEITGKKVFRYGLLLGNYHGATNTPLDNKSDAKLSRIFAGSASEYCLPGGNRSNELALKSYVDDQISSVAPKRITAKYKSGSEEKTVSTYAIRVSTSEGSFYTGTFSFSMIDNDAHTEANTTFLINNVSGITGLNGSYDTNAISVKDFDRHKTNNIYDGWVWSQATGLATKQMSITFSFSTST